MHSMEDRIDRIAGSMKADAETVADRVEAMLARNRELERDLERLKARVAASHGDDLAAQAVDIEGLKVLAAKIDGADPKALRKTVDRLKGRLGSAAVVLAAVNGGKVALVAGVTGTTPIASRPECSRTMSRGRSAGAGAGVRSLRRPAATTRHGWIRRSAPFRGGCASSLRPLGVTWALDHEGFIARDRFGSRVLAASSPWPWFRRPPSRRDRFGGGAPVAQPPGSRRRGFSRALRAYSRRPPSRTGRRWP